MTEFVYGNFRVFKRRPTLIANPNAYVGDLHMMHTHNIIVMVWYGDTVVPPYHTTTYVSVADGVCLIVNRRLACFGPRLE